MITETPSVLPSGTIKRIHVDQARLRKNRKEGTDLPPITVQTSKGPFKCHEVDINGPSKLVYAEKPLSCGAILYVETHSEIVTMVRES